MAHDKGKEGQRLQLDAFNWAHNAHLFLDRKAAEVPGLTNLCDDLHKRVEEYIDLAIGDHATNQPPTETIRRFQAITMALKELRAQ